MSRYLSERILMKKELMFGSGNFIGSLLVKRLSNEGFLVRRVDVKYPEFSKIIKDEFIIGYLGDLILIQKVLTIFDQNISANNHLDELNQFVADIGEVGDPFICDNNVDIIHNSALISLNIARWSVKQKVKKLFNSSSSYIYPKYNQIESYNPKFSETSAYPIIPDNRLSKLN